VALQVAEQMADFLLQGAVANAVNMPSVSAEDAPKLKPYMKLAEQLGSFAGQLVQDSVKEIQIEYEGHVATLNVKPLTALILAGFLKPSMEGVNIVSAPLKAKEIGIGISETKREKSASYQTQVRVTVVTAKGQNTVAGTIVADTPRIIDIDGVPTEAALSHNMLYVVNLDKPGLIGAVGTILGSHNVNIANFTLGRIPGKNKAVALVSIDEEIPEKTLAAISDLEQVERVLVLRF
jgi:D-3-phosphoglycerate dehydrogenase